MTREKAIEILTKELKCNSLDECNLKCDECGMLTSVEDLMEAYGMAIIALGRPKGHGRLIDADELLQQTLYNPLHVPYISKEDVLNASTIVEAGKEDQND